MFGPSVNPSLSGDCKITKINPITSNRIRKVVQPRIILRLFFIEIIAHYLLHTLSPTNLIYFSSLIAAQFISKRLVYKVLASFPPPLTPWSGNKWWSSNQPATEIPG
jgi:hypothetical protein